MPSTTLSVAMIGHSFMGAAHSLAWRTAPRLFDLPLDPVMSVVCGRDDARAAEAARRLGWAAGASDWRSVVTDDAIDLVDICTPGDSHAAIAIAALEAGKHVLCEKPLANSVAEAEAMVAAAEKAARHGVRAMVGFTYRRVPAIALARQLVAGGPDRRGATRPRAVPPGLDRRPGGAAVVAPGEGQGRLRCPRATSAAHVIDLTQFITGDRIQEVSGRLATFVEERPLATEHAGLSGTASAERGAVTVDDAAAFLAQFAGGAMGVFEATRFATGRKNAIRIEVNGSRGSLAFDFEDMNVLEYYDATEPAHVAGFRRILVTEPEHPYVAAWWPAGHGLGYEHSFTHQVVDLVRAIAAGTDPTPTFADGLQVQRVLAAVEASSDTRQWQETAP